jgi:hypothetical protein
VLLDPADDGGIAGILQEMKRVPEAKGGLERRESVSSPRVWA